MIYFNLALIALLFFVRVSVAQTTFTGSRGFAPTFKTLDDAPVPKANLSIQVPGNVELNGCARFVKPEGDICLCGDGPADLIFHDTDCDGTYDPGDGEFFLGAGGDGGSAGLDAAFDIQNHINSASAARPLRLSNLSDDFIRLFIDGSGSPTFDSECDGGPCHVIVDLKPGFSFFIRGNGVDSWSYSSSGTHTYKNAGRPFASVEWGASAMIGDGTDCDSEPTAETINGKPEQGLRCPMASSEVDGIIYSYGQPVTWRGNWDKSAGVAWHIKGYMLIDPSGGTRHGRLSMSCVAPNTAPGDWSNEVELNLSPTVAYDIHHLVLGGPSELIDTDTAGADCNEGDDVHWRLRTCDTYATTPSSGCISSAGSEDDITLTSIRMEYRKTSNTERP